MIHRNFLSYRYIVRMNISLSLKQEALQQPEDLPMARVCEIHSE